jgi:integrase/recombinase XerD
MAKTTEMEKIPELDYQSFMAEAIRDYLDYLDHLGFRVVGPAYALARIDRFLIEHHIESFDQHDPRWVMTRLVDQYQGRFKGQTLRAWQQAFQGLCRYLVRDGWMKGNPLAGFPLPRSQPYHPYVFSPGELRRFFDYLQQRIAQAAHARARYRAHCLYALYHLLYACGLRVSEAVHLAVADYAAQQRTLYIQPSKFHKDRLIPIGSKAAANLDHVLSLRSDLGTSAASSVLFLKLPQREPYHRDWISQYFRNGLQHLGIYRPETYEQGCYHGTPHLHDLRRAFAVHRLLRWYREGAEVDAKLPLLATYMGHGYFGHTKTYLTLTQELLSEANRRFARRFDRLDWVSDDPPHR